MLGAAVCGVAVAVLVAHQQKGSLAGFSASQKTAISTQPSQAATSQNPASTASASAPPAPAPSGSGLASAPPSEQGAAQALAQLLVSSASDRGVVVAAVSDVNACRSGLSQDVQTFQDAASSRQQLISELNSLSGASALPSQLIQDLSDAWQASAQADQDFATWASDENSGSGCTPNDSGNSSFQAATEPDDEATVDKKAFVSLWNPIASQYGLTTYQWNQL